MKIITKIIGGLAVAWALAAQGENGSENHTYTGRFFYNPVGVSSNLGNTVTSAPLEGTDGRGYMTLQMGGAGDTNWNGAGALVAAEIVGDNYARNCGNGATTWGNYSLVHQFDETAGEPVGPIVQNGAPIIGLTRYGGDYGGGTIYQVGTNGADFRILHSFSGMTDGVYPNWIEKGNDGYLYGTTSDGGTNGRGTLFSIAVNGADYRIIHHFGEVVVTNTDITVGWGERGWTIPKTGGSATMAQALADAAAMTTNAGVWRSCGPVGITVGPDGTLYGATRESGRAGVGGGVFKINKDGSRYQWLADLTAIGCFRPTTPPAVANDGSLYGTTMYGGVTNDGGYGAIYKITGTQARMLYAFDWPAYPNCRPIQIKGGRWVGTTTKYLDYSLVYQWSTINYQAGGSLWALEADDQTVTLLHKENYPYENLRGTGTTGRCPVGQGGRNAGPLSVGTSGTLYVGYGNGVLGEFFATDHLPIILTEPNDVVTIPSAPNAWLSTECWAIGDTLSYEWYENGKRSAVDQTAGTRLADGTDPETLGIALYASSHMGHKFQCKVTTPNGVIWSREITVTQPTPPQLSTGGMVTITAILGQTITLSTKLVSGSGPVDYYWTIEPDKGGRIALPKTSETSQTLLVQDSYKVTVLASNNYGTASTLFRVIGVSDTNPPSLTLKSPGPNAKITVFATNNYGAPPGQSAHRGQITLSGTAKDHGQVADVQIWLTGPEGPTRATATWQTQGTQTVWTATALVIPGTYKVEAWAVDDAGNLSKKATETITVLANKLAPTLTVTAPKTKSRIQTGADTLIGKVSAKAGMAGIWTVQWAATNRATHEVTGGGITARPDGAWIIPMGLSPGSNLVTVTAMDFDANTAKQSVEVTILKGAVIAIRQNGTGRGTITGTASVAGDTKPSDGATLNVNEDYTITATPDKKSLFVNWTQTGSQGILLSTNKTLKFRMTDGLTLEASYKTNYLLIMSGTYNALITTDGTNYETLGAIRNLAMTASGAYSGQILWGTKVIRVTGCVAEDGILEQSLTGDGGATASLEAYLGNTPEDGMTGTMTGAWGTNRIMGGKMGTLTTKLLGWACDTNGTQGTLQGTSGTARVRTGLGTVAGKLANRKAFVLTGGATKAGWMPVYCNLGTNGLLFGWLEINTNVAGALMQIQPTSIAGSCTNLIPAR